VGANEDKHISVQTNSKVESPFLQRRTQNRLIFVVNTLIKQPSKSAQLEYYGFFTM
jgi:hypothetical protein